MEREIDKAINLVFRLIVLGLVLYVAYIIFKSF